MTELSILISFICMIMIGLLVTTALALCRAAGRADRQMEQFFGKDYSG